MHFRRFLLACALAVPGIVSADPAAVPPASPACFGTQTGVTLTVDVTNLRNAKGEVAVTVYPDNSDRFLAKGGKLARQRVPAVAPTTEVCFYLPAAAYYAVAIYHDENANRDFDRTLVGYPDEGFGFSNDAPTTVGLPSFSDARFAVVDGANAIRIQTRYP